MKRYGDSNEYVLAFEAQAILDGWRDTLLMERQDHAAEVERLNAIVRGLQDAMRSKDPIQAANCRVLEYHQLKEEVERLEARISTLQEENDALIQHHHDAEQAFDQYGKAQGEIERLTAERDAAVAGAERAEEALRDLTPLALDMYNLIFPHLFKTPFPTDHPIGAAISILAGHAPALETEQQADNDVDDTLEGQE